MNDWNIQSRAHSCQACNRTFTDKQVYHTLLFDHKELYERLDICDPCWQAQYSQGSNERKGFVSYWQGVYEAPPPPAPEAIQKENAESLLRKVMEANEQRYAAASYILAVMLERKRLLKVKEQYKREGQRVFVYEHARTGDIFTIPDPNLQLDQLEQVQHEVADLLEHGLHPSAEPPVAPAQAVPSETPASEGTGTAGATEPYPSENAEPGSSSPQLPAAS